jgi:6-phosphogluconolactonase
MKLTIGTYTKRISQGIYTIELNEEKGMLENPELLHEIQNATYLDKQGKFLFTVVKNGKSGLRMYEDLRMVDEITSEDHPPCFVSANPAKEIVFSANYHEGHVDLYSTKRDRLIHLQRIVYATGSHAHCISYLPRFNEVVVCDLGLDRISTYSLIENRLTLKHIFDTQPKQGPRHFVAHPTLPILYVLAELSSEVVVLKRYEDRLELLQTISTLPIGEDQIKSAAAIRISDDGRYLYVSNRGHDSLTAFKIPENGTLVTIQNVPTYGKNPRDFNLSPDGKYIVVGNLDSDMLTLYKRDIDEGKLTLLQKNVFMPEPACIVFDK